MADVGRVEIVLDFACVESYLGFARFSRAASRCREAGGAVEVDFAPFRLRPEASPEGEPLFELHRRERGEAAARANITGAPLGKEEGLWINLSRVVFTNTFQAHRLLGLAQEQGAGERMAERLFRAYFTDGLNIADRDTLSRLAEELGVADDGGGAERTRAELERVARRGYSAVPVFRFGAGTVLHGPGTEEGFLAALRG